MESLHEQIEYGSWCQHGQPLGTPGGADLMCGYCEDGLDTWVEDPYMVLVLTLDGARHRPSSGFWASDLDLHPPVAELRRLAKFKAELVFWSDLAAEADCPISFEMVQGRGGYWVAL